MANTSDIRNGLCIRYNHDIFKIIEFLHVKPGKGPAFVRTKLKSVTTGKVIDNTFSAGHKIDEVRVETHKFQFLYNDAEGYHLMNQEDYSQIALQETAIDRPDLLKEGDVVTVIINSEDGLPLSVEMPNTATNATKPATVETGAEVMVPLFINEGDKIKIETAKGTYKERVKE